MTHKSSSSDLPITRRFSKEQPLPKTVSELKTIIEPFFGFTFERLAGIKSELDDVADKQREYLGEVVEEAEQIKLKLFRRYRLEMVFTDIKSSYNENLPGLFSNKPRELAIAISKGTTILKDRIKIVDKIRGKHNTEFNQLQDRKKRSEKRLNERIKELEEAQEKEWFLSTFTPQFIEDAYRTLQIRQFNTAFMNDYEDFCERVIRLERAIKSALKLVQAMDLGVNLFLYQLGQLDEER